MIIIIAGYIQTVDLRYGADQQSICNMKFAFQQRSGQSTVVRHITITAWNSLAEDAAATYAEGGYAIIEASYRDQVAERIDGGKDHYHSLSVSRIHPGHEGLELNVVSLVGAVGGDSELKKFESGALKTTNTLALRRTKDATDWISIEAWAKNAETMANYVPKGKLIAIKGTLKIDIWNDAKTGLQRAKPLVVVDRLTLLGGKSVPKDVTEDTEDVTESPSTESSSPAPTDVAQKTKRAKKEKVELQKSASG